MPVARTHSVWAARLNKPARVGAPAPERRTDGGAQLTAQPVELGRGQTRRPAQRGDPRAPQSLVGEQVADSGDGSLVQQPGFDRHLPATDPPAELVAVNQGGVGTDVRVVGVEHSSPQSAAIAEDEAASVSELDGKAVRAQARGRIDHDHACHPEVEPERGAVGGVEPEELPPAMSGNEAVPDQGGGDLTWRMRATDVGIAIVDKDDLSVEHRLQCLAGALGFG